MTSNFHAAISWSEGFADQAASFAAKVQTSMGVAIKSTDRRAAGIQILSSAAASLDIMAGGVRVRVFGELHSSDLADLEAALGRAQESGEAARVLATQAWGSYVAFLDDGERVHAFRDPSGARPLFLVRSAGLQIAASQLTPALLRAASLSWSIDHEAFAHALAYPPLAGHRSAVREVEVVAAGRLAALAPGVPTKVIWSPSDIARRAETPAPEELSSRLDNVLAVLTTGRKAGVELSGGFDSSLVFSSLANLGVSTSPFNVVTASKGGDERAFAQDVAHWWGSPLSTYPAGDDLPDYTSFERFEHGALPALHGLDSVFASARQKHVDRESLDLVLTGQGGDALFFRLPTRLVAADRVRAFGARALLDRSIVDDARRVRCSIWSVIATALGSRKGDDRTGLERLTPHLLGRRALGWLGRTAPAQPWLEDCRDLPPAKQFHVMMLSHCQLFHGQRLHGCSAPVVHPLLTQPMLELVIGCPTFVLQQGGLDRGLARKSFHDRLPPSVLGRRNKGEATDHYARAALANRAWLGDQLLNGELVKAGLLDREQIENALRLDQMRLGTDYRSFVQYASLESWLRQWS